MAVTKIGHQNSKKHLKSAIDYICRPDKTGGGRYVGYQNCNCPYEDFILTKEIMAQMRHRKDVMDGRQGYHIVISFSDADQDKVTSDMAMKIIAEFAQKYIPEYEAVFSVHEDTRHKHCHLIWNSVNAVTGKKYHYQDGDWAKYIQPIVNDLTAEYGLDTINVEDWATTEDLDYATWQKQQNGEPVWGDYVRHDIDQAIMKVRQDGGDYDMFIHLLQQKGYKIPRNGKVLTLVHPGREKGVRTYKLGAGYQVDDIKDRIAGKEITEFPDIVAKEKKVSPLAYPAAVSKPVKAACKCKTHVEDYEKLQVYTAVRYRYGIRLYKARRAYYPCIAAERPAYGILNIRKISWQNRKYSIELNRIAGDYAWMIRNDVRSLEKAQKLHKQILAQKRKLYARKKKLTEKKNQLLEERELLITQLAASTVSEQDQIISRIKEIDINVMNIDMSDVPGIRKEIAELREEEKRAERISNEIQAAAADKNRMEEKKINGRITR